jgi:hypothetical protein
MQASKQTNPRPHLALDAGPDGGPLLLDHVVEGLDGNVQVLPVVVQARHAHRHLA